MHAQGREQAYHAFGYPQRRLGQRAVFTDGPPGQAVNTACDTFELACGDLPGEYYGGQPVSAQIAGAQQGLVLGKRKHRAFLGGGWG